jgi:hypothetical protein
VSTAVLAEAVDERRVAGQAARPPATWRT